MFPIFIASNSNFESNTYTHTQSERQSAEVHNVMTDRRRKSANINTTNEWQKKDERKKEVEGKVARPFIVMYDTLFVILFVFVIVL